MISIPTASDTHAAVPGGPVGPVALDWDDHLDARDREYCGDDDAVAG